MSDTCVDLQGAEGIDSPPRKIQNFKLIRYRSHRLDKHTHPLGKKISGGLRM